MIKLQIGQSVLIKAKKETQGEYVLKHEFTLNKAAEAKNHSAFGNPDEWDDLFSDLFDTKAMKKSFERILWPEIKHLPGVAGFWIDVDCDVNGQPKTEAELLKLVSAVPYYVTLTIEVELPWETQTELNTVLEKAAKRL